MNQRAQTRSTQTRSTPTRSGPGRAAYTEPGEAAGLRLDGLVIAVTGAGGPAGHATVARLAAAGARVWAADADAARLADTVSAGRDAVARYVTSDDVTGGDRTGSDPVTGTVVDLLDPDATHSWARQVEADHGHLDGLVHLVGGWRGGRTFADNTADDWDVLHNLLIRTVQHATLAFHDALLHAPAGRFALVSATSAAHPTAGNAGYAAAKAAAEAWTLALADSFRRAHSNGEGDAAATVLVVKALLDDRMRHERPDARFAGFTDVTDLAETVASLWRRPASELNGHRLCLTD